jgi:hypothetical protein
MLALVSKWFKSLDLLSIIKTVKVYFCKNMLENLHSKKFTKSTGQHTWLMKPPMRGPIEGPMKGDPV